MKSLGRALGYLKPTGCWPQASVQPDPGVGAEFCHPGADATDHRQWDLQEPGERDPLGAAAMIGVALLRALFSFTQGLWAAKARRMWPTTCAISCTKRSRGYLLATTTGPRPANF